jgi:hypothetical protein
LQRERQIDVSDEHFESGVFETMYELETALRRYPRLHLRYSKGPEWDARSASTDAESGLELPGLGAQPLAPENWWLRPVSDWFARQIWRFGSHSSADTTRIIWVLIGREAGRGPDCEPLLTNIVPVARLSDGLLAEAEHRYERYFTPALEPGVSAGAPEHTAHPH